MKKNVLIVEDESIVGLEIAHYIEELGFNVVATVSSAKKALEVVMSNTLDLILMDVQIKGDVDGISCAKEIKAYKNIPLIYISAFSDDETLSRAIETNPNSYLVKPFNEKELKVAMSIATKKVSQVLKVGDVVFDDEFSFNSKDKELVMLGETIHLTKQETQLLRLLLASKNSLVSIYEVENCIWPNKPSNENTRRALISRLRTKLKYKFLETIHSIGYKINI